MTVQYETVASILVGRGSNGTYTANVAISGAALPLQDFATLDALLACCGELIAQDLRQRKTLELPKVGP